MQPVRAEPNARTTSWAYLVAPVKRPPTGCVHVFVIAIRPSRSTFPAPDGFSPRPVPSAEGLTFLRGDWCGDGPPAKGGLPPPRARPNHRESRAQRCNRMVRSGAVTTPSCGMPHAGPAVVTHAGNGRGIGHGAFAAQPSGDARTDMAHPRGGHTGVPLVAGAG